MKSINAAKKLKQCHPPNVPVCKGRVVIPTSQSLGMDHIGTEFGIALSFSIQCATTGLPKVLVFSGNYALLICILIGNI